MTEVTDAAIPLREGEVVAVPSVDGGADLVGPVADLVQRNWSRVASIQLDGAPDKLFLKQFLTRAGSLHLDLLRNEHAASQAFEKHDLTGLRHNGPVGLDETRAILAYPFEDMLTADEAYGTGGFAAYAAFIDEIIGDVVAFVGSAAAVEQYGPHGLVFKGANLRNIGLRRGGEPAPGLMFDLGHAAAAKHPGDLAARFVVSAITITWGMHPRDVVRVVDDRVLTALRPLAEVTTEAAVLDDLQRVFKARRRHPQASSGLGRMAKSAGVASLGAVYLSRLKPKIHELFSEVR